MIKEQTRILHIDDDEANRYAVKVILEKEGYSVISAEDGRKGLALVESLPDLIILDIRLPDINGFDLCRQIKANPQYNSISVLQTSATFTSSDNRVEGLESGADGYLAQPIESTVLVATVRSLLRIRNAEKKAQEASQSREDMLAIVSHDLRNPLSFIMLQMKLLERQLKNERYSNEKIYQKLHAVTNSCQRMNRLIQDLLDVSSIEEGKFNIIKSHFYASELLNDSKTMFEDQAKNAGIKFVTNFSGPDLKVLGDRERLLQIMANLISNSIKFTPHNGTIEVNCTSSDNKLKFEITDTGAGIAKVDLEHVFDRFWQGHLEKKGGFGLGLSIVKGIIEAHHGEVELTSEVGVGTKVSFYIPANG